MGSRHILSEAPLTAVSSQEFRAHRELTPDTANLRTKIMDFRGFDSSRILMLRGGIPRPIGDFPESLSQAILVGIILVGRLGVDSRYGQSADWEAAD